MTSLVSCTCIQVPICRSFTADSVLVKSFPPIKHLSGEVSDIRPAKLQEDQEVSDSDSRNFALFGTNDTLHPPYKATSTFAQTSAETALRPFSQAVCCGGSASEISCTDVRITVERFYVSTTPAVCGDNGDIPRATVPNSITLDRPPKSNMPNNV